MSTYWLRQQLQNSNALVGGDDSILVVEFSGRKEQVYCPNSNEYRVTAEIVEKAKAMGATIIAYSNSWCGATYDAKQHGRKNGIEVMPFGSFFAYLKRHGALE